MQTRIVGQVLDQNGFPGRSREAVVFTREDGHVVLFLRETYWGGNGVFCGGGSFEMALSSAQAKWLAQLLLNAASQTEGRKVSHVEA